VFDPVTGMAVQSAIPVRVIKTSVAATAST
jgi:hypothetical protein